jgi:hypothetical protein
MGVPGVIGSEAVSSGNLTEFESQRKSSKSYPTLTVELEAMGLGEVTDTSWSKATNVPYPPTPMDIWVRAKLTRTSSYFYKRGKGKAISLVRK